MSTGRHRNRTRRPGRRKPFREPKPIILVVCEGEATEPEYINALCKAFHNSRVTVKVASEHGVPLSLVKIAKDYKFRKADEARRERDENIAYDSVWVVFDRDDHPNVPDALTMARDNGIEVAMSNPSFELWLLLHFRDSPGMQSRDVMARMLRTFISDYDKHIEWLHFASGYPEAVGRAKRLDYAADADRDHGRNPTTGVYKLAEEITN